MSSASPFQGCFIGRDAIFPNTDEWNWRCHNCNDINIPPGSILTYGLCARCQHSRCRECKILWENTSPYARYDHTPEPVFKGSERSIQENRRLLGLGHGEQLEPGVWMRGGFQEERSLGLDGHGHAKPAEFHMDRSRGLMSGNSFR